MEDFVLWEFLLPIKEEVYSEEQSWMMPKLMSSPQLPKAPIYDSCLWWFLMSRYSKWALSFFTDFIDLTLTLKELSVYKTLMSHIT